MKMRDCPSGCGTVDMYAIAKACFRETSVLIKLVVSKSFTPTSSFIGNPVQTAICACMLCNNLIIVNAGGSKWCRLVSL